MQLAIVGDYIPFKFRARVCFRSDHADVAGAKAHLFCSGERDELATREVHRNWPGEDVPRRARKFEVVKTWARQAYIACMAFNVCSVGVRGICLFSCTLHVPVYSACIHVHVRKCMRVWLYMCLHYLSCSFTTKQCTYKQIS